MKRLVDVIVALVAAVLCHGSFLVAVGLMAAGLATGMQWGMGRVPAPWGMGRMPAPWGAVVNGLLVVQFPLLHSALLTTRGRQVLGRLVPGLRGRVLAPTSFATIASLQLIVTFAAWTPSGIVWLEPAGAWWWMACAAFLASWLFLVRALSDAGLSLQTGSLGWWALLRGRRPVFPCLPTRGVFRTCRQPIYFAFFLLLWTGPVWTPDHLFVALAWSPYCLLAPRWKEQRFLISYGGEFASYRDRVPYFFPSLLRKRTPRTDP